MNIEIFKCLKCNNESHVSDWVAQTKINLKEIGVLDDESHELDEISVDMINDKESYYYQCPECDESCFIEDGHISYTIESPYLAKKVAKEHRDEMDIKDGDLLERIYEYTQYELDNILIKDIMYDLYSFDEGTVDDYSDESYETMPPIVLHPIIDDKYKYIVVDGVHRIRARIKNEECEIWAFIPKL